MPRPAGAPAPAYKPRSAQNDLKEIVEDRLEELLGVCDERFAATYGPMDPRVIDILERFLRCQ